MALHGFGVIGCGLISDTHIKAIQALPNAKLVAVCDVREEAARKKAEQFGCGWYTDIKDLFARDDIEIVNVVVPSGLHAKIGVQAAEAGKHVICTKPIDITLEAIDRLIAAGDANHVKIAATHQCRNYKVYQKIRQALDAGLLGRLLYGNARVPWFRSDEYYSDGWHGTFAFDGGGALINQSIHYIDLLLWYLGKAKSVCGFIDTLNHQIEVEDYAGAAIVFENGAHGIIQGSTCTYKGHEAALELHGTKGNIIVIGDEIALWEAEGQETIEAFGKGRKGGASDPSGGMLVEAVESHISQIGDVIAAIEENRDPLLNAREARRAVELITAIYRASKTRQVVMLPL